MENELERGVDLNSKANKTVLSYFQSSKQNTQVSELLETVIPMLLPLELNAATDETSERRRVLPEEKSLDINRLAEQWNLIESLFDFED